MSFTKREDSNIETCNCLLGASPDMSIYSAASHLAENKENRYLLRYR
jgi:hypothetical protein